MFHGRSRVETTQEISVFSRRKAARIFVTGSGGSLMMDT
jgi:hypothetical protein